MGGFCDDYDIVLSAMMSLKNYEGKPTEALQQWLSQANSFHSYFRTKPHSFLSVPT